LGNEFTLGLTTHVALIYHLKKLALFCLSPRDPPNHDTPTFGTIQKPSIGVHQLSGFLMFKFVVQEYLNIEQFCQREFNKMKINFFEEIGVLFESP
jgi:hypothetical protein